MKGDSGYLQDDSPQGPLFSARRFIRVILEKASANEAAMTTLTGFAVNSLPACEEFSKTKGSYPSHAAKCEQLWTIFYQVPTYLCSTTDMRKSSLFCGVSHADQFFLQSVTQKNLRSFSYMNFQTHQQWSH